MLISLTQECLRWICSNLRPSPSTTSSNKLLNHRRWCLPSPRSHCAQSTPRTHLACRMQAQTHSGSGSRDPRSPAQDPALWTGRRCLRLPAWQCGGRVGPVGSVFGAEGMWKLWCVPVISSDDDTVLLVAATFTFVRIEKQGYESG